MKRFLSVILALFIVVGTVPAMEIDADAASGPVFEFALNSDGETYSVTKCSWSSGSEPFEATIPSTYNNKNVVSIGSEAFTSTGLLERLIIPDTITTIAEKAFYKNSKLEYISFPESITSVGADAFTGCQLRINISDIGKWCNINFANANANPLSKSTLYLNNEKLVNLVIPSTVSEIKPFAFYGCYTIESLVISDSVKNMGEKAFYKCENLKSVKIGDNLTKISDYAFAYCSYLESVEIGSGVSAIGKEAFSCCEYLNRISLGENLKTIGQRAFASCKYLYTITIPDTVTSIGSGAFSSCQKLNNIVLSKNIQVINSLTFQFCTSLKYIVIPEKVKKINFNAFYDCRSLLWIALYSNIESFGTDAFYHTYSVKDVFYVGTKTQWKNISIPESDDYNNQYILDADVHCKCTETFIAPTCTNNGTTTFTCTSCYANCSINDPKQGIQEIPALGHSFIDEWTVDTAASCKNTGSKSRHCTKCDEVTDVIEIPITHGASVWEIEKEASCTSVGIKSENCLICGANKSYSEIPSLGHNYSDTYTTDKVATCTINGSKSRHCLRCDAVTDVTVISATGHSYGEWIIDRLATSNTPGERHKTCSVCGNTVTDNNVDYEYFDVSFITNGGSCDEESRTLISEAPIGELPIAIKVNYIFKGWTYTNGGKEFVTETHCITSNTNLYSS